MKNYRLIEEKELDIYCETLLNYTKEMVENSTNSVKLIFSKITREAWSLLKFSKRLASVLCL